MNPAPSSAALQPAQASTDAPPCTVFVQGASGLLAAELLRLLEMHPALVLGGLVSREEGVPVQELHPHLAGEARTTSASEAAARAAACLEAGEPAAWVLALPHGASAGALVALERELGSAARELVVLDLAADFRLRDASAYQATYGRVHPVPERLGSFQYALPELHGADLDWTGVTRLAAPGCFATALQLACVPAARAGLLDPGRAWSFQAVTGSSGAGAHAAPATHHPFRNANLQAYALDGHRHEAELRQALGFLEQVPPLHLVPQRGPFARGIHLSASLPLRAPAGADEVAAAYAQAYAGAPFVEVCDAAPELRAVLGSNRALLHARVRDAELQVFLALDNLVKGGAGQGVQALNRVLGLPETTGLPRCGWGAA